MKSTTPANTPQPAAHKHKWWAHALIIAAFAAASCIYFAPALGGKALVQGDTQKAEAMAHEQKQYAARTGEDIPNWNASMFSGMPGYQTAVEPQHSLFTPLKALLIGRPIGAERHIAILFLYLLGFYVALLAFGVSPWVALVGAAAFGLGSYNIIIVEAGHITKAWAISMMAPVLGGMALAFRAPLAQRPRRQGLWGFVLFTLALGLQITFNHIQITFYTLLAAVAMGVAYAVFHVRRRSLKPFLAAVALLVAGAALAFGSNARLLLVNEEYAKYTMRGGSEITVTPNDLYHDGEAANAQTSPDGLSMDYAYQWSYGIGETYTLLVPGARGGGSGEQVDEESESYKAFRQTRAPLYWGDQPFTSGPVYFGAIVCFLFVLGLFVVKGPERWWLLVTTVVAILMSWGRHLGMNEWLFQHLPLYNKFRTPSMSLVMANVTMALMAALALKEVLSHPAKAEHKRAVLWSAGITMGLVLLMLLMKGSLSFSGAADQQMAAQYGAQWPQLQAIFVKDRQSLFVSDSWRTLLLVAAAAATLLLVATGKAKRTGWATALIGALIVGDLWGVDRRYLNEENFTEPRKLALRADPYDIDIDQAAQANGDVDYRVFNMAVNTFNDSKPSAFHHQIGGYHAAKLRRYQDVIDFYLSRHLNVNVLNMLNTRYFVVPDAAQGYAVQRNVAALGNAWFVETLRLVPDANAEIMALNDFNPATTAIVDESQWGDVLKGKTLAPDTAATIALQHATPYDPDHLTYATHSATQQLAVFSEVFYAPDWRAYVDGKPADYLRANYILRALVVPAGDHVVEFRNEAPRLHRLDTATLIVSLITLLALGGAIALIVIDRRKERQA